MEKAKKVIQILPPPQTRNWVHVARLNQTPGAPIKSSTAYKWSHIGRFPELFKRIGGKLFLDLGLLYEMAEAGNLK